MRCLTHVAGRVSDNNIYVFYHAAIAEITCVLKEEKSIDLAIFRHATMSVHCLPSTFINFNIPVPPACLVTKHVCIYNLYIKQVKCYTTVYCISLAVHFLPVLSK